MGWELYNGDNCDRLPIDSRFIAKLERVPVAKAEQASSKFYKKWRSGSEYSTGAKLKPEERLIYNYVADMVASGQAIDPVSMEYELAVTSPKFSKSMESFYGGDVGSVAGELRGLKVGSVAGDYASGILEVLSQKGLVRYT